MPASGRAAADGMPGPLRGCDVIYNIYDDDELFVSLSYASIWCELNVWRRVFGPCYTLCHLMTGVALAAAAMTSL